MDKPMDHTNCNSKNRIGIAIKVAVIFEVASIAWGNYIYATISFSPSHNAMCEGSLKK